jgi:hypothetical protein
MYLCEVDLKQTMKNLHILPTDKPSRIYLVKSNNKLGITSNNPEYTQNFGSGTQNQHIYITSDEEIKEGDRFHLDMSDNDRPDEIHQMGTNKRSKTGGINFSEPNSWTRSCKKIILTTDQDLIKDGVQAIDDEFLEWFVKNPSCESVEVEEVKCKGQCWKFIESDYEDTCTSGCEQIEYKIIIPKEKPKSSCPKCRTTDFDNCHSIQCPMREEPKQETLEEAVNAFKKTDVYINEIKQKQETLEDAAVKYATNHGMMAYVFPEKRESFINGAKWQSERMYSEEDMKESFINGALTDLFNTWGISDKDMAKEKFDVWFEQFKKK